MPGTPLRHTPVRPIVIGACPGRRAHPMQHPHELDADDLLVGSDAHHEIAVLIVNYAWVEAAHAQECFASEQDDAKVRIAKVKLFWDEARGEWRRQEHPW